MMNSWATSAAVPPFACGTDLHLELNGSGLRAGLTDALREAVRTRRLVPGTRLPSSRSLTADLGVQQAHSAAPAAPSSWLRGFGRLYAVGVEGTGSYGAGLARHLAGEGVIVVEINRPDRRQRRMKGKSDPLDAYAAAEAVLSGRACTTPKLGTRIVEAIRALHGSRASAVKARTSGSRSTSRKSSPRSNWASATPSSKASTPRSDSSTPAATDTTAPKR